MCEGVVLLNRWKQGNTWFSKPKKTPRNRGLFLCLRSDKNMGEFFNQQTNKIRLYCHNSSRHFISEPSQRQKKVTKQGTLHDCSRHKNYLGEHRVDLWWMLVTTSDMKNPRNWDISPAYPQHDKSRKSSFFKDKRSIGTSWNFSINN